MKNVYYDEILISPIGPLTLCATDEGLYHIDFGKYAEREAFLRVWSRKKLGTDQLIPAPEMLKPYTMQLGEYFEGKRREFQFKMVLFGTAFQQKTWQALSDIPYGETRSYREIANAVNAPKAVRAVGGANHVNPLPIVIPCHRVIGTNGAMVGYGGGLPIKERLLELEGYPIRRMHSG